MEFYKVIKNKKINFSVENLNKYLEAPKNNIRYKSSFDTKDFDISFVKDLSLEDGASTLTDFTAAIITQGIKIASGIGHPNLTKWLVCGGGRKNKYLMDKFNIQINKTSRNTVLFMTNIGTTRGSVTYLTNALLKIADELDEEFKTLSEKEGSNRKDNIKSLTEDFPPLPDFSYFHHSFQAVPGVPGGNIREAFFLAYNEDNYEYMPLKDCLPAMEENRILVASSFIIPYPPGFPVLVPGQVVSKEIIRFLTALDVSEIHGYRADLGLRIFRDNVLNRQKTVSSMGSMGNNSKKKITNLKN